MPAPRPPVDPGGLMEFSVVFTDRALNHMSQAFQQVMRDISALLREVYAAHAVAVVPGCSRLTQQCGRRRRHSIARVRSNWFWAALSPR